MSILCQIVWRSPHCMCFRLKIRLLLTITYGEKLYLGYAQEQPPFQPDSVHLFVFHISTDGGSPMRRRIFITWSETTFLLHALTPTTGGAVVALVTATNMIGCRRRVGHTLAHILPALPCAEKRLQSCIWRWHSLFPLLS